MATRKHFLGLMMILNLFVSGQGCSCAKDKHRAEKAFGNGDIKNACRFLEDQKRCCLFSGDECGDEICDTENQLISESGSCSPTVPIIDCLDGSLSDNLHNRSTFENCPTIKRFLNCAAKQEISTNLAPAGGISFRLLNNSATEFCEGAVSQIYRECKTFVDCYRKLFYAPSLLVTIFKNSTWWCNQLKLGMECTGLSFTDQCSDLDYASLTKRIPLNIHTSWSKFCKHEQTSTPKSSVQTSSPTISDHRPLGAGEIREKPEDSTNPLHRSPAAHKSVFDEHKVLIICGTVIGVLAIIILTLVVYIIRRGKGHRYSMSTQDIHYDPGRGEIVGNNNATPTSCALEHDLPNGVS